MAGLGERTLKMYMVIVQFKGSHCGDSPTLRELQGLCNMGSTSVVSYHLERLAKAGMIGLENPVRGGHSRMSIPEYAWVHVDRIKEDSE